MTCPVCGNETHIINTRDYNDNKQYRRRKCVECGARFSTIEQQTGGILEDATAKSLPKGGYYCSTLKGNVPTKRTKNW